MLARDIIYFDNLTAHVHRVGVENTEIFVSNVLVHTGWQIAGLQSF